jgi:hypothetical protein
MRSAGKANPCRPRSLTIAVGQDGAANRDDCRRRPLSRHPGVSYARNRRTGAPHGEFALSILGTSAHAGRLRHQSVLLPPLRPCPRSGSDAGAGAGDRAGAAAVGGAAPVGSPAAGGGDAGLPAQPTVCGTGDARAGATSSRPLTSAPGSLRPPVCLFSTRWRVSRPSSIIAPWEA